MISFNVYNFILLSEVLSTA